MEGWQRCFILHSRPYSETSLLLDVFSENVGRLSVLARGARANRSRMRGMLQPFTPLLIRIGGRGSLKSLYAAEAISLALPLTGVNLYCGLYLNELLTRVLGPEIPLQPLFFDYLECLQVLAVNAETPEIALRRFELALLAHLGYGPDFLHCAGSGEPITPEMTYQFHKERGFTASLVVNNTSFTGRALIAFAERNFVDKAMLSAAKRFTRIALKPYLGGKPMKSQELFRTFMPATNQLQSEDKPDE
jgi:DNA repair protein RecO (recombination protein O)